MQSLFWNQLVLGSASRIEKLNFIRIAVSGNVKNLTKFFLLLLQITDNGFAFTFEKQTGIFFIHAIYLKMGIYKYYFKSLKMGHNPRYMTTDNTENTMNIQLVGRQASAAYIYTQSKYDMSSWQKVFFFHRVWYAVSLHNITMNE